MGRFAIAGAGIAGLTAALALGRDGHAVSVFERRAEGGEAGAGLQLSPNATRLLDGWGLLSALEAVATEPEALVIRRGSDATVLGIIPLGPTARARYAAPSLVAHRADLHATLTTAVRALPGVALTFGTPVAGFDPASGTVRLSGTAGPDAVAADGLVRADGVHAPASDESRPVYSGKTAWRALVPAAGLSPECLRPCTNLWLGPSAHVVHYPLRRGTVVNVVVIVDGNRDEGNTLADIWSRPGDGGRLQRHLRGWHATPLRLLAQAATWQTWPLLHRRTPIRWSVGRQTAVGDAAHPMLPFLAQGASQSVEDAAALAAAVATSRNDIPAAFQIYERNRSARVSQVQRRSERQGRIYHLGGPPAAARDLALKLLGPRRLLAGMDWLYEQPKG